MQEYLTWNPNEIVLVAVKGSFPSSCQTICKNFISGLYGTRNTGELYNIATDGKRKYCLFLSIHYYWVKMPEISRLLYEGTTLVDRTSDQITVNNITVKKNLTELNPLECMYGWMDGRMDK